MQTPVQTRNYDAQLNAMASNYVALLCGNGAPTGTTGAPGGGAPIVAGPGSLYFDLSTGLVWQNVSTTLGSPFWKPCDGGYVELSFTSAQVKALRATPQTLVPAPGAGFILELLSAELYLDYGGTNVFTAGAGDDMAVKYTNGAGVAVSQTIECTAFLTAAADTRTNALPKIDQIVAKAGCENQALVLHNTGGAEFAGNAAGDNVLRVKVRFTVHRSGW